MVSAQRTVTVEFVTPAGAEAFSESVAKSFRQLLATLRTASQEVPAELRLGFAQAITGRAMQTYWGQLQQGEADRWPLAVPAIDSDCRRLASNLHLQADRLGALAAHQEPVLAGYLIGEVYTALLPKEVRARNGIYYTPPALSTRLLFLADQAGVSWRTARVLDPACGGGAFLTPVALAMVAALESWSAAQILHHVSDHLQGLESDPFGAWLSQTLLEAALAPLCRAARMRLPQLVKTCDALVERPPDTGFDLVIGNPPYGRVTLAPELRARYARSLYGHANLYGIFMDLAIRWTRPEGLIAFITPTSFLGGEYYRSLRALLSEAAPPTAVDLVVSRSGVFSDVLQETLLATYQRNGQPRSAPVHLLSLSSEVKVAVHSAGAFRLPATPTEPWLVPRAMQQVALIARLRRMPHRLRDYGYEVSTGPLVWNRHKRQFRGERTAGSYPVVWSEAITAGGAFSFRTVKKARQPFLKPTREQGWLLARTACVLVQRTTAKEQQRRLVAAVLPAEFIDRYGAVVVENHLNMVRPVTGQPRVSLRTLALLLSSAVVDEAFRCINGSVAVSASELEALPLPSPETLQAVEALVEGNRPHAEVEAAFRRLYGLEAGDGPA